MIWLLGVLVFAPQDPIEKLLRPPQAETWVEVQPHDAAAKLLMPAEPRKSEREVPLGGGKVVTAHGSVLETEKNVNFSFIYYDEESPPVDAAAAKKLLDGSVRGVIMRTLGDIQKIEPIRKGPYEGRSVEFTCLLGDDPATAVPMRVAVRSYLIGKRLYTLTYAAEAEKYNEEDAKKFHQSFQLTPATDK